MNLQNKIIQELEYLKKGKWYFYDHSQSLDLLNQIIVKYSNIAYQRMNNKDNDSRSFEGFIYLDSELNPITEEPHELSRDKLYSLDNMNKFRNSELEPSFEMFHELFDGDICTNHLESLIIARFSHNAELIHYVTMANFCKENPNIRTIESLKRILYCRIELAGQKDFVPLISEGDFGEEDINEFTKDDHSMANIGKLLAYVPNPIGQISFDFYSR